MRQIDDVSRDVIGAAMQIHRDLGPGMLETIYERVLAKKLLDAGYCVDRQRPVELTYEGLTLGEAFRIDLLIDDQLIVEVKSVEHLNAAHSKQLLTYLRLMKLPVGLLINFSDATLKEGLRRLVNDHKDSAPSAASAFLREPTPFTPAINEGR